MMSEIMSDPEDTGAPEIHPNKRIKTLTRSSPESSPSSSDKGKSKLEVSDWENEWNCCGICLSESGNGTGTIIRGCIDCCDHYFCFVCITEWSKVESRCPMCKRRFSTIRRPPKPPVFPSERVVNVPVRDQVYHYLGNATTGPPDLYEEVQCNVCHSTADDSLLLLCDLCDTAYHTYCVGLGATVPEGDWFCADCSLLKAEQAQGEIRTDCDTQASFDGHRLAEPARHVSICEIVRESYPPTASLDATENSSRTDTGSQSTSQSSSIGLGSVGQNGVVRHATKFNARTLGHCRNVHDKIRTLRQHWNGFRRGSLTFSSTKMSNASIAKQKPVRFSCSGSSQPMTSQSLDQNKLGGKGSIEVEKAWKMMNMAKAIERGRDRNKSFLQASTHTVKKNTSCKKAGESSSRSGSLKIEQHQQAYIQNIGSGSHFHNHTFKLDSKLEVSSGVDKGFSVARGPSYSELVSSKESQTSVQPDICHAKNGLQQKNKSCAGSTHLISSVRSASISTTVGNDKKNYSSSSSIVNPPQEKLKVEKSGIKNRGQVECDAKTEIQSLVKNKSCAGSTHLISSVRSASISTTVGNDKENHSSSSSIVNPPQEKLKVEKSGIKNRGQVECDAKTEIQSLVKLNLKILCGDKKLEVGTFKQVARLATHSILAACGLEHRRPGISSLPECVCVHTEEVRELRRSTLMPNSCRECFFLLVKNVVNTILLDNS